MSEENLLGKFKFFILKFTVGENNLRDVTNKHTPVCFCWKSREALALVFFHVAENFRG